MNVHTLMSDYETITITTRVFTSSLDSVSTRKVRVGLSIAELWQKFQLCNLLQLLFLFPCFTRLLFVHWNTANTDIWNNGLDKLEIPTGGRTDHVNNILANLTVTEKRYWTSAGCCLFQFRSAVQTQLAILAVSEHLFSSSDLDLLPSNLMLLYR